MKAKTISCFKNAFLISIFLIKLFMPDTVHARPMSVILYPNDAKVTEQHSAKVSSEGNRLSAVFFLPIHTNRDTLMVDTPSGSVLKITSVTIDEETMPVEDQVETLKNQLKDLTRQKSEHENRIMAETAYIDFWQTRARSQVEKIENVESVEKLGNAVKKGITDAHDKIFTYNRSIEELSEQINDIQKQLNDLTGASKKRLKVTVNLTGVLQPAIDLTCSYHIGNCRWRPTYTLNALPSKSTAALNWYAEITQNTGIDWKDVHLKVATARAVTRPEPPFIRDWVIMPQEAITYSKDRRKAAVPEKSLLFEAAQVTVDTVSHEAPLEPIQEAGFSFDTYDMGKRTISSGESSRITIRELIMDADYKYLIRPHEAPQAFLFAQIDVKDEDFIKLPEGSASFLVDSAFIANRPFSMHDKKQKLFFGSDPQVDVTLTTVEKKADETGFLIGKKQYQWGWKVSVNNLKTNKITVLMEDAYPQIRDKRIKLDEKFNGIQPEKEDNTLKWTFPVQPQAKTDVEYGFSVTYPDDMDLWLGGR